MERALHLRIDGPVKMVLAWIRYREVFRADWWGTDERLPTGGYGPLFRVFRPFASPVELDAPLLPDGTRVLAFKDWLRDLEKGGKDDLDLRLHEVDWHGVRGQKDRAGVTGIGSNDMVTRARTTKDAERREAMARLAANYDVLIVHGAR